MHLKLRSVLAGLVFALQVLAGSSWSPVPPDVWAIKEGAKGAVVLEERIRFDLHVMESVYQVRIFSDEGRGAAALPDLPKTAFDIRGRTVYPDGHEITFDSRKDFAERVVEAGGREKGQIHLMAPGVTSDCVVEVRWRERSEGYMSALPARMNNGLYGSWRLGNAYPTRLTVLEIPKRFPLAYVISGGTRGTSASHEENGYRVITYRDLPAVERVPYSIAPTNGFPRMELYWQPEELTQAAQQGMDAYWTEAIRRIYRPDYEDSIDKGGAFKQLKTEVLDGLPATPHAKALELLKRLDSRIKNLSMATSDEAAALPKKFWEDYDSKRLDKLAASGMASGNGMRLLCYHLLKAAGINPKIGKVVDRDVDFFNYHRPNPWQFHHDILGIEEAGKGDIWLDPSLRHAAPGVIHPDYAAVPFLVIDTKDAKAWKPSRGILPAAIPDFNTRRYTYLLGLSEDSDRFKLKAQFDGYFGYVERHRYISMEPKEQVRLLKEQFEKEQKNQTISEARVDHVTDAAEGVSWVVEGIAEREPSRRRVVTPFPGMPSPLWVPDKMDETRSVLIVLPYLATQIGQSSFEVPKGYTFNPQEEYRKQNQFGSVQWSVFYDADSRRVAVHFRTQTTSIKEGADSWTAFKEFLGWVQEAYLRTVVLTKDE